MKVRTIVVCLLAVLALATSAAAQDTREGWRASLVHRIEHFRQHTNVLRRESGQRRIATDFRYRAVEERPYRRAVLALWQRRFRRAWRSSVWVRLAACESNGKWHIDGYFDGGLQFLPGTWSAYRPARFPRHAHRATPLQQVIVARRVLRVEGWNAWPACRAALGLR